MCCLCVECLCQACTKEKGGGKDSSGGETRREGDRGGAAAASATAVPTPPCLFVGMKEAEEQKFGGLLLFLLPAAAFAVCLSAGLFVCPLARMSGCQKNKICKNIFCHFGWQEVD